MIEAIEGRDQMGMMVPSQEQFSGCLIGQCLGDALGFPVEGHPPLACQSYVKRVLRAGRVTGRSPFPFGQYTDDSQLARELLQSYLECGRFDPADYARRIAAIFSQNRIVGRGRATETAARRLAKRVPWDEAGTPSPSAGNGSAMRAGPIGLLFYDDIEQLARAAHDQGRITHQDPRCSAGAVAIAGAVSLILRGDAIEPEPFLSRLSGYTREVDQSVATGIQELVEWVPLPPDQAVGYIARYGKEPGYSDGWRGISPFVTGSVLWSLYAFLRTPADYWETICTAIAVGGDVDTTAAMAGAISGAHLGLGTLPAHLTCYLTDQGTWGYQELVELANQCRELKVRQVRGSWKATKGGI